MDEKVIVEKLGGARWKGQGKGRMDSVQKTKRKKKRKI